MQWRDNRNGFGNTWDGIIALIVIAAIFGGNGNGLFGGGNNSSGAERQMLMDAIQRNGTDLSQLASTLNCSVGQIQAAVQNAANMGKADLPKSGPFGKTYIERARVQPIQRGRELPCR